MSDETKETQVAATDVAPESTEATTEASATEQTSSENRGRRGRNGGRRGNNRRDRNESRDELMTRVVTIRRVSKTHKGGRTMSFAALVVVGDGRGTIGVGYGKSREVPSAIAKGELDAKKNMFTVPRIRGTVPHPVIGHDAAGTILLRPAAPGTGVIAGGPARALLECAGITDILSKSMGSSNALNIVNATVDALRKLEEPQEVAARRGLPVEQVAPARLLREQAEGLAEQRKAREEARVARSAKDGE